MEKNPQHLTVELSDQGKRIDRFLADHKAYSSRSAVKKAYDKSLIELNGKLLHSLNYKIKPDDRISFSPLPLEQWNLEPIFHPLEIVFEDAYYLVVIKPAGVLTHSSTTNRQASLVNHLLFYTSKLADQQDVFRPGIVHRLDKDTSGLLIIAKTYEALDLMKQEFSKRAVQKSYYALVLGKLPKDQGKIEEPLGRHKTDRKKFDVVPGGRYALSVYQVLAKTDQVSLLQVQIITGRTHQIRVHLQHLGHPILGDRLYGGAGKKFLQAGKKSDYTPPYLCLHAFRLRFTHPFTGQPLELHAPLSEHFTEALVYFGLPVPP